MNSDHPSACFIDFCGLLLCLTRAKLMLSRRIASVLLAFVDWSSSAGKREPVAVVLALNCSDLLHTRWLRARRGFTMDHGPVTMRPRIITESEGEARSQAARRRQQRRPRRTPRSRRRTWRSRLSCTTRIEGDAQGRVQPGAAISALCISAAESGARRSSSAACPCRFHTSCDFVPPRRNYANLLSAQGGAPRTERDAAVDSSRRRRTRRWLLASRLVSRCVSLCRATPRSARLAYGVAFKLCRTSTAFDENHCKNTRCWALALSRLQSLRIDMWTANVARRRVLGGRWARVACEWPNLLHQRNSL